MVIKRAKKILRANKSIVTAESCSGGQLAALLTLLPGSSKFFYGGYVVYTVAAKEDFLRVKTDEPTSVQAALALARALPNEDVRVSVVGNLGPGREPGNDLGSVVMCIKTVNEEKVFQKKFRNGRLRNRLLSSYWALDTVAREIK